MFKFSLKDGSNLFLETFVSAYKRTDGTIDGRYYPEDQHKPLYSHENL
jgi:hypothetical protein